MIDFTNLPTRKGTFQADLKKNGYGCEKSKFLEKRKRQHGLVFPTRIDSVSDARRCNNYLFAQTKAESLRIRKFENPKKAINITRTCFRVIAL